MQIFFSSLQSAFRIFGVLKNAYLHSSKNINFEEFCQIQTAGRLLIQRTLYSSDLVCHMTDDRVVRHLVEIL